MKPVLTVDLGMREMRLLESDGRQLRRHAEVLLPDGAMADGMPTRLLTATLRGALEDGGFRARTVRVAISEGGTAFRTFSLPRIPPTELSSAVMFEARRLLPMDAEDVYYGWHAAREGSGYAIYLVAARRALIDAVLGSLASAGLQVDRVDLKPLALARGMRVWEGLLLDWGAAEATVGLMVRGRPRFYRSFQLDAAPDQPEAQLEELALALDALVKFMRGSVPDLAIGPTTHLALAGRFAFLPNGAAQAAQRFPFQLLEPSLPIKASPGLPWQAHFTGIGLLQPSRWMQRITPTQGGDTRVAA